MRRGGDGPGAGPGAHAGTDSLVSLGQVILGEIFSDYTPAQVVVKELRASAGPLEQRKFISEAQPYRYRGLWRRMWALEAPSSGFASQGGAVREWEESRVRSNQV